MSDFKAAERTSTVEDEERSWAPLCWIPILMAFLSFLLGICCLFFMSIGGLVLCILHCTVGCILVLIPYGVYQRAERLRAIAGIISTSLYMVLLVSTFAYAAWLLAQNARAENERGTEDGSPLITPSLDMYAAQSGFTSARRLEAADESMDLDALDMQEEAGLDSKNLSRVLRPPKQEDPGTLSSSSISSLPTDNRSPDATSEGRRLQSEEELLFGSSDLSSDSLTLKSKHGKSRPSFGSTQDKLLSVAQQTASEMLAEESSSLNPVVLRQGAETLADYKPTKGDVKCLAKMQSGQEHLAGAHSRLYALLDWGLFCGYTRYSVSALRKWPISCEEDCHFGKLHFSRYRENEAKTREQGYAFMNSVQAMSKEQAQFCIVLAAIAACRIEEKYLQYGAMAALCFALIFCICLLGFAAKCLVECIFVANKDKRKVAAVS